MSGRSPGENECRFTGVVMWPPTFKRNDSGRDVARFTIEVASEHHGQERSAFITLHAYADLASACGALARGDLVKVSATCWSWKNGAKSGYRFEVISLEALGPCQHMEQCE